MILYAELILPLALEEKYTYQIDERLFADEVGVALPTKPEELVGCRAVVSFGRRRFYTGVIAKVSTYTPESLVAKQVKPIERILDERPLITREQLELWHWVADYYHAQVGQVMRLAMPSGLLPESKTLIFLSPDFEAEGRLKPEEETFLDLLQSAGSNGLSLQTLEGRMGRRLSSVYSSLMALGAIHTEETVISRYRPRLKAYLQLAEVYRSREGIEQAFDLVRRAKAQQAMLGDFVLALEHSLQGYEGLIARQQLSRAESGRSALIKKLVDKQILLVVEQADSRIAPADAERWESMSHTEASETLGLAEGVNFLSTADPRQKEMSIIQLVRSTIARGEQVLLLSPSAQHCPSDADYLSALERASDGAMYYYHPDVNEGKRCELYRHLAESEEACLVVGTRQAVFLPMRRLGLVIIDEEQEYLYKQQFAAPYYHARDVALYLATKHRHKVLLVSSSPSGETLFNVLRGKYHRLEVGIKPPEVQMPPIHTIDIAQARERGAMPYGRSISPELQEMIAQELVEGRRVLLLQNRRGYAPYMHCMACRQNISCPDCDVSLNYYARERSLRCHYCGYTMPLYTSCPSCHSTEVESKHGTMPALRPMGYGAERVEEEVSDLFPEARVMRLDSDSLQTNRQRREARERIEAGDVDIIVGTQLIRGQAIWDNIGLIAVIYLDSLLGFPDFRNEERAYQLLYQLMLRSSLSPTSKHQRVVIQTAKPDSPFIASLRSGDYFRFMEEQLMARRLTSFPPFVRMSVISLKGYNENEVQSTANTLAQILKSELSGVHVSEAQTPSIARIEGRYIRQIVCRRPYNMPYKAEREAMRRAEIHLRHHYPEGKRVQIYYDIDPL